MTLASDARAIALHGVRAVEPGAAVGRALRRDGPVWRIGSRSVQPGRSGRVHLVAVGKAASAMVDAAARTAGPGALGLAITPRGSPRPRSAIPVVFGDHPVPGASSFAAGRRLLSYVRSTASEDLVLFLLSGGGSAVAEVPVPGVSPADLRRTTELFLASGAPIGVTNAVRRHLSDVKGGRLALATTARRYGTLAVSDVVGDAPSDIASGPTVGDPTTYAEALSLARQYKVEPRLPRAVREHLERGARGELEETPKPWDPRFRGAIYEVVASNRRALDAAAREACRLGYRARVLSSRVVGESQPVARAFARRLVRSAPSSRGRPVALLSGGETTVALAPRSGRGGRNQEFALAAARVLAGHAALVLSLGTDGIDGPTDAAGGWTDGTTLERARRRRVDVPGALRRHFAYDALARLGGLVVTGPTGTNVMDLHVGLVRPRALPGPRGSERRAV